MGQHTSGQAGSRITASDIWFPDNNPGVDRVRLTSGFRYGNLEGNSYQGIGLLTAEQTFGDEDNVANLWGSILFKFSTGLNDTDSGWIVRGLDASRKAASQTLSGISLVSGGDRESFGTADPYVEFSFSKNDGTSTRSTTARIGPYATGSAWFTELRGINRAPSLLSYYHAAAGTSPGINTTDTVVIAAASSMTVESPTQTFSVVFFLDFDVSTVSSGVILIGECQYRLNGAGSWIALAGQALYQDNGGTANQRVTPGQTTSLTGLTVGDLVEFRIVARKSAAAGGYTANAIHSRITVLGLGV
jgi:hypothetical protein